MASKVEAFWVSLLYTIQTVEDGTLMSPPWFFQPHLLKHISMRYYEADSFFESGSFFPNLDIFPFYDPCTPLFTVK